MDKKFIELGYVVSLAFSDGDCVVASVRDPRSGQLLYVGEVVSGACTFLVQHSCAVVEGFARNAKVIDEQ